MTVHRRMIFSTIRSKDASPHSPQNPRELFSCTSSHQISQSNWLSPLSALSNKSRTFSQNAVPEIQFAQNQSLLDYARSRKSEIQKSRRSSKSKILADLILSPLKPKSFAAGCENVDPALALVSQPKALLPLVETGGQGDGVRRITAEVLASVLDGQYAKQYSQVIIIDCRYDYEYQGGHIRGAKNINSKQGLQSFFQMLANRGQDACSRIIVVFHCEYSQSRAPKAYTFWRKMDREVNNYPILHFPEIYVLQGGYRDFYPKFPSLCDPNSYVSMFDQEFQRQCKESTRAYRKSWATR